MTTDQPADPTELGYDQPWRVGNHYGVHVYQGDRPVATFFNALEAEIAVSARNLSTPVLISPEMIGNVAQAIRDSNLTPPAREAWEQHPQLVPAHVYAEAALVALLDQGYVIARAPRDFQDQIPFEVASGGGDVPMCPDHRPTQHRDMKPPWCENCGLTEDMNVPVRSRPAEAEKRPRPLRSVGGRAGKNHDDAGGFDRP